MKKEDKKGSSLSQLRANRLKAAVDSDKSKCQTCSSHPMSDEPISPIKMMLQKLSTLGLPGMGASEGSCGCGSPAKAVIIKVTKTLDEPPVKSDEPPVTGQKKVLEKDAKMTEAKHSTSPFVRRCVAAVTGGKPSDREEESSAFAKCVSTQQKSDKDLDAAALRRPGMKERTKQFEKSLDKVREHHQSDN